MKASDILAALERRHPRQSWALFPELRVGTGYRKTRGGSSKYEPWEQRIDLWTMCYYPSKSLEKVAYEIKVSRSDFKHELENPLKRKAAMDLSHKFFFAAPVGLILPEQIPDGCGLIEVREDFTCRIAKRAPWRECDTPPWRFVASLARRVQNS
ncbi:hypothetical protein KKF82_05080 [Patescibacteria group bacterium]|nr:hypothetical protein [Patescibacteria group bacterium]